MYVFVSRLKRRSSLQSLIVFSLTRIIRHRRLQGLISMNVKQYEDRIWIHEVWESRTDMLRFRKSSHHMKIISRFRWIFAERESIQFETDAIPNWDDILGRMATIPSKEIKSRKTVINRILKSTSLIMPVMISIMLFIVPSPIEPATWDPAVIPTDGVYVPNHLLSRSELLAEGRLAQPEDLTFDQTGRLYVGTQDGKIYRITMSEELGMEQIELLAETGGYPLGLQFDAEGHLIAAVKEKGLVKIGQDGTVELLTNEVAGTPITYANELAIAKDGTIFFTDSSIKFDRGWPFDILEGRPHGRLLAYYPDSKETKIVHENMYFPNGLVLSPKEDYLLIAETPRYRIQRFWLSGRQAGMIEPFAENLPNMPDNLFVDQDGDIWIGGSKRINNIDNLQSSAFLKNQVAKLPVALLNKVPTLDPYGLIVRLSSNGKVIQTLHDPDGSVFGISSVIREGDTIYMGTLFGVSIGRYELRR